MQTIEKDKHVAIGLSDLYVYLLSSNNVIKGVVSSFFTEHSGLIQTQREAQLSVGSNPPILSVQLIRLGLRRVWSASDLF